MENISLKITAIEKSIEQMQKSINDKHPILTISKFSSRLATVSCRFAESLTLRGHSQKITGLSWGKGSVYNQKLLSSISADGSIIFWNTHLASPITKWYLPNSYLTSSTFEAISGKIFCVGSFEGMLSIYNSDFSNQNTKQLRDKPVIQKLAHESYISELQFLSESALVTASGDRVLKIWDLNNLNSPVSEFNDHSEDVMCVDTNGDLMVSGSCDSSAKLWDIRQKKVVRSFNIHLGDVNSVKFISSYSFITGCADGFMRLLDMRGLNVLGHYRAGYKIESIDVSLSGRILFCGGEEGDTKVWDIMNETSPVQTLPRNCLCVKLNQQSIFLAGTEAENVVLWQHVIYS